VSPDGRIRAAAALELRSLPECDRCGHRRLRVPHLGHFAFAAPSPARAAETLFVTGARDKAIPAWATRFFAWLVGLARHEVIVVPDAGHLLFHDHLDVPVPLVTRWLDARL
jgi:pimeloyl-ACP methyl ester carboxylesterase